LAREEPARNTKQRHAWPFKSIECFNILSPIASFRPIFYRSFSMQPNFGLTLFGIRLWKKQNYAVRVVVEAAAAVETVTDVPPAGATK
jgi:hypothetical protein